MKRLIADTYVADRGWRCRTLRLEHEPVSPEEVRLEVVQETEPTEVTVEQVEHQDGLLTITTAPFPYGSYGVQWTLSIRDETYSRKDVTEEHVEGLDGFTAEQEGSVLYRLYRPEASVPRPLILFLHGVGESRNDNFSQMVGTVGAIRLAERYPDMYIMVPQAPARPKTADQTRASRQSFAEATMNITYGWTRTYLSQICDIIRKMIAAGQVDPHRVYVTGLSMGGGGALCAMSVGADLFAASAPVCPTMTTESFAILRGLTHGKLWISAAYVDHTIYRHKYIVDGILELRDRGNQDAHLTLYSPEELQAYGIATDPNLSLKELFEENHNCWILTYNNEHGILSWLTEQVK